jgi:hypothetical protein
VPDRLLHHSTVVSIQSEGYRLKDKRRAGLIHLPAGGVASRKRRRHPFMGPQCRARASLIGEVAQELLALWLQPIRRNLSRFGFLDFHGMFSPSA